MLALWAYPSTIVPLSYRLHAELAKEHDGETRWGYRQVHCGQIEANGRSLNSKHEAKETQNGGSVLLQKRDDKALSKLRASGVPHDLDWVYGSSIVGYESMGDLSNTAQVHPYLFTTSMATLAEEAGAKIEFGSVTSIERNASGVSGVTYTEKGSLETRTIPATDVVISAGPWTSSIFPSVPISALRAHSVTIRPSREVSAYALFTEILLPPNFKLNSRAKKRVTPEIYARPNCEVYACGEGDHLVALPPTTEDVVVDESRCQDIVDYVGSISDELRDGEVTARQACYLPQVEGTVSGPLIGETDIKGLLMAAGHTCWGIQNGPGTGKLISELVFDGQANSADISSLDPRRAYSMRL